MPPADPLLPSGPMSTKHWRDVFAVAIALAALAAAPCRSPSTSTRRGSGSRSTSLAGHLIVAGVEPHSQAAQDGLQCRDDRRALNGTTIIGLPQEVYADPDPSDPNAAMPVTGVEPAASDHPRQHRRRLRTLAARPRPMEMEVILLIDLATGSASSGWSLLGVFYPGWSWVYDLGLALVVGLCRASSWEPGGLVTGRSSRRSPGSASRSPRPRPLR